MVSTRAIIHLATLALLFLSLVALLPDCASACMCAIEGSRKERAEKAIANSDSVFSGEVLGIEKEPPDTEMVEGTMLTVMGGFGREATITLQVSEVWKGQPQQTVRFTTPFADGASCAIGFEEGREYLVYANEDQDLKVGGCSETKPLSRAGTDLVLLGDSGEKPEDGTGEVLSDTSGGLQTPVVIGLLGLAVAGSLLLAVRLLRAG
jgi:hypothetical protein